jgi:hypothetical protein
MAGTPYYGCGPSCAIVLPTGDGIAEDVAYLAPDVLVTSCDRCAAEVEVEHDDDLGGPVGEIHVDEDGATTCLDCLLVAT